MTWVPLPLQEAARNVAATPIRFGFVLLVFVAITCGISALESNTVRDLLDRKMTGELHGRYVFSVSNTSANDDLGIDGQQCDSLADVPGIRHSGVVATVGIVRVGSMPGTEFTRVNISPGALALFGVTGYRGGGLLGGQAASTLGVANDTYLATDGGIYESRSAMGIVPIRTGPLDRSFVDVAPAALISGTCYVEIPGTEASEAAVILQGLLGERGREIIVNRLPGADSLGPLPVTDYQGSLQNLAWAVAAGISVLFFMLFSRTRRQEFVLYQVHGASASFISAMLVYEHLLLLIPTAAYGVAAALLAADGSVVAAHHGIRVTVLYAVSSLTTTALLSWRTFAWRATYSVLRKAE